MFLAWLVPPISYDCSRFLIGPAQKFDHSSHRVLSNGFEKSFEKKRFTKVKMVGSVHPSRPVCIHLDRDYFRSPEKERPTTLTQITGILSTKVYELWNGGLALDLSNTLMNAIM